jgi:hypothetical protein
MHAESTFQSNVPLFTKNLAVVINIIWHYANADTFFVPLPLLLLKVGDR